MAGGFRVEAIKIEGFKGFTTHQVIDLKGRHVFLLGRNGNGKSSIVEAIRWGMFGSTNRPSETVANRGYNGVCRVILTLARDGKRWKLQRTLIRGASGGSDAILTDENGQERSIREVIPQLDSVDAGEGTHIIFSSQSAPLGRQPADLNSFQRTVLNHLGLLRPQSLLSHLNSFLMDQELLENNLSERLTNGRRRIDVEIDDLERQRGRILKSPPWGGGQLPTLGQSESKARDLIQEISGNPLDKSLDGLSFLALIENAADTLNERREQTQGGLQQQSVAIASRRARLAELRDASKEIEDQNISIKSVRARLSSVLSGASLDELRKAVVETREASNVANLKRRIANGVMSLLSREQADNVLCPVCTVEHQRHDLQSTLDQTSRELSGDASSSLLDQVEDQLSRAEALESNVRQLEEELVELEHAYRVSLESIDDEDKRALPGQVNLGRIDAVVDQLLERKNLIDEQIKGNQSQLDVLEAQSSNLRYEARFHQLQEELVALHRSKDRFAQVVSANDSLVTFGQSVQKIRQTVESCFNNQLKEEIPKVSKNLSQVFTELTNHPYFDLLTIAEDTLPNLELRVSSSQDPTGVGHHPASVLNGQAESALALVPYFAFSQADDAATEMHLMMMDDPTQAFDEEHTEMLIERLVDLGNYVQLLVASQETDRFRRFLSKHFKPDSCVIIEPTNWSYYTGPELKIEPH